MSKSVYVVGGIGAVGCLMMSLMMQHLLKARTEQSRSPVSIELEQALAQHVVEPIEVTSRDSDGERMMLVRLKARPQADAARLARSVGDLIWRRAYKWSERPDRLQVEVRSGEANKQPVVIVSRPQGLDGLRPQQPPPAVPLPGTSSRPPNPPK